MTPPPTTAAPLPSTVARPTGATVDHAGRAAALDADFFARPPAAIGPVWSADTTVRTTARPWSPAARVAVGAVVGLAILSLFVFAASRNSLIERQGNLWMGSILGGAMVPLAWFVTRRRDECSFVGRDGLAVFTRRTWFGRTRAVRERVLAFASVGHLYGGASGVTGGKILKHTPGYRYRWAAVGSGRTLLRLRGFSPAGRSRLWSRVRWEFARAADEAWTAHYLARVDVAAGEPNAPAAFPAGRRTVVVLGPGYLEFRVGRRPPRRITKAMVAGITRTATGFVLRLDDARWYRKGRQLSIPYAKLGDIRAFLALLDRHLSYRWD